MSDASFTSADYAILTEDGPNQKYTSVKNFYTPIVYESKTFTPSQLKISIYEKIPSHVLRLQKRLDMISEEHQFQ